ncbi:hypothetical protein GGI20_005240, partial [Coemansia sp. BCRC 34301]
SPIADTGPAAADQLVVADQLVAVTAEQSVAVDDQLVVYVEQPSAFAIAAKAPLTASESDVDDEEDQPVGLVRLVDAAQSANPKQLDDSAAIDELCGRFEMLVEILTDNSTRFVGGQHTPTTQPVASAVEQPLAVTTTASAPHHFVVVAAEPQVADTNLKDSEQLNEDADMSDGELVEANTAMEDVGPLDADMYVEKSPVASIGMQVDERYAVGTGTDAGAAMQVEESQSHGAHMEVADAQSQYVLGELPVGPFPDTSYIDFRALADDIESARHQANVAETTQSLGYMTGGLLPSFGSFSQISDAAGVNGQGMPATALWANNWISGSNYDYNWNTASSAPTGGFGFSTATDAPVGSFQFDDMASTPAGGSQFGNMFSAPADGLQLGNSGYAPLNSSSDPANNMDSSLFDWNNVGFMQYPGDSNNAASMPFDTHGLGSVPNTQLNGDLRFMSIAPLDTGSMDSASFNSFGVGDVANTQIFGSSGSALITPLPTHLGSTANAPLGAGTTSNPLDSSFNWSAQVNEMLSENSIYATLIPPKARRAFAQPRRPRKIAPEVAEFLRNLRNLSAEDVSRAAANLHELLLDPKNLLPPPPAADAAPTIPDDSTSVEELGGGSGTILGSSDPDPRLDSNTAVSKPPSGNYSATFNGKRTRVAR